MRVSRSNAQRILLFRNIAERARQWAEHVIDTEWAAHNMYGPTMSGFCALAAIELFRRLYNAGFDPRLVLSTDTGQPYIYARDGCIDYGEGHCYVLCDGYVIDITATQFGKKKIEIRGQRNIRNEWFWNPVLTFKTISGFRRRLLADCWGEEAVTMPRRILYRARAGA